jgi:hypothetical protein
VLVVSEKVAAGSEAGGGRPASCGLGVAADIFVRSSVCRSFDVIACLAPSRR